MAGRHKQASAPGRRRRPALATVVIALLAAAGVAGALYLSNHRPPAPAAAVKTPTGCRANGDLNLVVDVAPAIAVTVNQLAENWAATEPKVGDKCIQVQLASDTVDQQELRLSSQAGADTDVWLPDSRIWPQRLMADQTARPGAKLAVTVHPSLASSPLVAVTSPARAEKMAEQITTPNYDPLIGARIPEPVHNAEGLLALLSENAPTATAPSATTTALVAKLLRFSHLALPSASDGFDQLAADPSHAAPFVATEQAVIAADARHGSAFAAAVYPDDPTAGLDFPVVGLSRPDDDPLLAPAAARFEAMLRASAARARFAAAGLRATDGKPITGAGAAQGVSPDYVPALTGLGSSQTLTMLRLWNAAVADANTLAVIDLSGSMAEPAGNGQSKVVVASQAAKAAVSFFPDSSSFGLWVFSSDQSATAPWSQLVPLGLLGDPVGPGQPGRRQALLDAVSGMSARVHGGTALYDTMFAAYQQVQQDYDPGKANSVVLLTDGQNDFRGGRTLDELLDALHSAADPQRPVQVIAIGIGSAADGDALARIASATSGKFYLVKNANDISGVFLDAVAQRRCRQSC